MTPEQYSQRLGELIEAIKPEAINYATAATGNMLRDIKNRLITKGELADGGQFTPYSTNPLLVSRESFSNKTNADKFFGKQKGGLKLLMGGYRQLRQIEGLQVAHKSFFRTGETLNSLKIITQSEQGGDVVIKSGVNARGLKIIAENSNREGIDILLPSEPEKLRMAKIFIEGLTKVIKQHIA